MKRSSFARKVYERPPRPPLTRVENCRGVIRPVSVEPVVVEKHKPVRCEAYRRWIASLPCCSCRIGGYSQCAHSNSPEHGKSKGRKADDQFTFPLCGPHGFHQGCHVLYDTGMDYSKGERREKAREWIAETWALARADGWIVDEEGIRRV